MILHPSRGALRSYHDRQLSERRAGDVARHLERCARCRARLEQIGTAAQRVRQLFDALEVDAVPSLDLVARRAAMPGLERAPFGWREWVGRPVPLPAPALVAVGVALVLFGWIAGARPEPTRPAADVQQPPPAAGQVVVVAQQSPSGRESRTFTLKAGNYRFIEEPTVHTSP